MRITARFTLSAALVLCSFLSACGKGELSRSEAKSLIEQALLNSTCKLDKLENEEPEFSGLRNTKLCSVEVKVTGITNSSLGESEVEFSAAFSVNRSAYRDWFDAYNRIFLRKRPSLLHKNRLQEMEKGWQHGIKPMSNKSVTFRLYDDGWRRVGAIICC